MKGSSEKRNDQLRSSSALYSGSQYLKLHKEDDFGGKSQVDPRQKKLLGIPEETPSKFMKQLKTDKSLDTE